MYTGVGPLHSPFGAVAAISRAPDVKLTTVCGRVQSAQLYRDDHLAYDNRQELLEMTSGGLCVGGGCRY